MLKQLVNEAEFDIRIISQTPMLINGGALEHDVKMSPVRTRRSDREEAYIPGSSAKGVLRSHAERCARTLSGTQPEPGACDPFDTGSCSNRLKSVKSTADSYARACPICKLFGCLSLQSRLLVSDFYAEQPADMANLERRDGVGINRVTGGSSNSALFNLEVAVGGKYSGTIRIRNFEMWQLGLVAFVLRDLKSGGLTFGMAKSRGLGQTTAELRSASIRIYLPGAPEGTIVGLAALGPDFAPYKFSDDPREREGIAADVPSSDDGYGLGSHFIYSDQAAVESLLRSVAPIWPAYIRSREAERS